MKDQFTAEIQAGYAFEGESIVLGCAALDKNGLPGVLIQAPLKTFNRHGLIAGATGTGKTKSLQVIAEQLSRLGVPSLLMDIKGDLSGIAKVGGGPRAEARNAQIGIPYQAAGATVELLSLTGKNGARLRATVTEFGPILFSRILDLSDVQASVVSVVFKYCDDHQLPLLDLDDFKKVLQYVSNEGQAEIEKEYGHISTASVGTILRKVIALEQQGADTFFGEPSFDVKDLCRIDNEGRGVISVLRLTDLQDRPHLFSTFMMSLLAELYSSFPEQGDSGRPELVLFIDEAHLMFENASKELLDQVETIVKLIRSKGIGLFFCTQNPADVPDDVLGQLGMKVQHALRAFTAKDREAIKLAVKNFPETPYYDLDQLINELGIGEALVSVLNEKGIPTPLAHTIMRAPESRMDILTEEEIQAMVSSSALVRKYNQDINRDSAYELLNAKIAEAQEEEQQQQMQKQQEKAKTVSRKAEKSVIEQIADNPMARQIGRTVARELTRGVLGVLGLGGSGKKKKGSWF